MTGWRPSGVISVLPTAFRDDGALDRDGIAALVRAHTSAGVSGLTVLGVMGEAAELTEEERAHVVETVLQAAGSLPIVLGISAPSASAIANRAVGAAAAGARAVMVSASASVQLGDAVRAAAGGGLPIVVQDYPAGSGVVLAASDIAAVVREEPLVVGIKAEAPPTASAIGELGRLLPGLAVVGGLGGLFLPDELRAGAAGTMTGFALPERLVAIVDAFSADPEVAEAAWIELLPLMRLEAFPPFSLAARKEVWRLRGVIGSSRCRRPGAVLDGTAVDDVRRAFERVMPALPASPPTA
jgi:4-hydroxy-tetrahydrodipicolinate synthase